MVEVGARVRHLAGVLAASPGVRDDVGAELHRLVLGRVEIAVAVGVGLDQHDVAVLADLVNGLDVQRDLQRPAGVGRRKRATAGLVDDLEAARRAGGRGTAGAALGGIRDRVGAVVVLEIAEHRRIVVGVDDRHRLDGRGGRRQVVRAVDLRRRQRARGRRGALQRAAGGVGDDLSAAGSGVPVRNRAAARVPQSSTEVAHRLQGGARGGERWQRAERHAQSCGRNTCEHRSLHNISLIVTCANLRPRRTGAYLPNAQNLPAVSKGGSPFYERPPVRPGWSDTARVHDALAADETRCAVNRGRAPRAHGQNR